MFQEATFVESSRHTFTDGIGIHIIWTDILLADYNDHRTIFARKEIGFM